MIYLTQPQINALMNNESVLFVKLKKEGERLGGTGISYKNKIDFYDGIKSINNFSGKKPKTVFQVNKDYTVALKGTRKALWYCPKCKGIDVSPNFCYKCSDYDMAIVYGSKPLRFKVTEIQEKKLLDITEKEAKKLGFNRMRFLDKATFFEDFVEEYYSIIPCDLKRISEDYLHLAEEWNPRIWLIEGVKKEE